MLTGQTVRVSKPRTEEATREGRASASAEQCAYCEADRPREHQGDDRLLAHELRCLVDGTPALSGDALPSAFNRARC